ncbi:uncharacterized protein FOMMEDRAFT_158969 [Fomitiporia mediterranea MF3/22]|uniref:uncharacterized protein n=1 Tax=Fomitiporia mediterranea (strain MF3/22) TaxID=694068 RepID=UPI0004407FAE|nr:uncharacterized protein FOMMEDRAFT_158969 [Fomitiporia mediterranea MF3/22]EJD00299.1 hypothetical protein FOMMEDRAFT_158969 [Fomitiporia mediterranea MF3/22]
MFPHDAAGLSPRYFFAIDNGGEIPPLSYAYQGAPEAIFGKEVVKFLCRLCHIGPHPVPLPRILKARLRTDRNTFTARASLFTGLIEGGMHRGKEALTQVGRSLPRAGQTPLGDNVGNRRRGADASYTEAIQCLGWENDGVPLSYRALHISVHEKPDGLLHETL